LEFKYANEYNEVLINNLKASFEELIKQTNRFLNENRTEIDKQILNVNFSYWDWYQNKKKKKNDLHLELSKTRSLVDFITEEHKQKAQEINLELSEFQKNISRKEEFIIEDGELYEVLGYN